MGRDSYRQGVDNAQGIGKPNWRLYPIDPDYADGFDGYMKEHPIHSLVFSSASSSVEEVKRRCQ